MVVILKDVTVESINETEVKKLKIIRGVSNSVGVRFSLELPEVFSSRLRVGENIEIHIDKAPIPAGDRAKIHGEGTVFRIKGENPFELIATVGGLRLILTAPQFTESERSTFEGGRFYFALF